SDGDPVPDSVNVDFTGCTVTSGSYTATLGGTIDYIDPTPTTTDWALRTRHTDFSRSVTNNVTGKTRSAVENGVRMVSGSADQLQFTETDFRTDYTFATGATASHVRTWSSTFTADQAGSIQAGSPLPSGNWNITGTSTWTSGLLSYSLAVTTNPQLHYNASCTLAPPARSTPSRASFTARGGRWTWSAPQGRDTARSSRRARCRRGRSASWPWAATAPCTMWPTACCVTGVVERSRSVSCRSAPGTISRSSRACTGTARCAPCSGSSPLGRRGSTPGWSAASTS